MTQSAWSEADTRRISRLAEAAVQTGARDAAGVTIDRRIHVALPEAGDEQQRPVPLTQAWQEGAAIGFDCHAPALTRRAVINAAKRSRDDRDWIRLLAYSNAWGYGPAGYGVTRHNRIASAPGTADRLQTAVTILDDAGPVPAYYYLNNRSSGHIRGFGPAFFTKFLYFADCAHPLQPRGALILDAVLAAQVKSLAGPVAFPRRAGWLTRDYSFYLALMGRMALERNLKPDQLEAALFATGRME